MIKKYSAIVFLFFISELSFAQNIAVNTTGAAAAGANLFEVTQPAGAANNSVGIFASNLSTASNAYAIWAQATGATNKYAIVVPSGGGYVGIGTSTPSRWLDVEGSGAGLHTACFLNTGGYGIALGATTGMTSGSIQAYSTGTGTSAPLALQYTLGGNVGINTASPAAPLHIYTASGNDTWTTYGVDAAVNTDGLNFGYSGGTFGAGTSFLNAHSATAANGKMYFMINWTTRMNINNSGYVGIGLGNSSPTRAFLEQSGVVGNTAAMFGSGSSGISLIANWPTIYFNGYWNAGAKSMVSGYGGNFCLNPGTGDFIWRTTNNPAAADAAFTETQQMTLLNNGNLGIGTASPYDKLHVYGQGLRISNGAFGANGFVFEQNASGHLDISYKNPTSIYSSIMTMQYGGNVGIGNTNPGYKLDVNGAIAAGNSDIYFTNTTHNHTGIGNTAGYAAIENASNYNALMILGRAGTSLGRYVRLWDYLQVNGSSDITGSLGIGTTSLLGKLNIYGGYTTTGLTASAILYVNGVTASPNSAQFVWGDNTGWKIHFGTDVGGNFTERMTIVDYGHVGIGTTSPVTKLDVEGPHLGAAGGTGVNSDAPTQAAIPDGSGGASRYNDWPNGWGGGISTWDIDGASTYMTGYATRSDKRYKKNILSLDKNVFEKFMQLQPVSYNINTEELHVDDPERKRFGFIANDVENIFPNLVINAGQPSIIHRGLEYDGFIPVLVLVVQEQQKIIALQKNELEKLNVRFDSLEKELKRIKTEK